MKIPIDTMILRRGGDGKSFGDPQEPKVNGDYKTLDWFYENGWEFWGSPFWTEHAGFLQAFVKYQDKGIL